MPILNLSSIYSFSSEDPAWPASNLLSRTSKKWRCKSAGEKKAFVCFQLDKPAQITGIDIGNEYSAHITVLVGRRGARDEDFQEILLATTFMSTAECRNATDFNRVRCFHKGALIESVAAGRWELVKLICTQPYSMHFPFGLSFVKVHVAAPDAGDAIGKPLVPATFLAATAVAAAAAAQTSAASPFAKFKMRADSTESDGETSTSLFSRWKQSKAINPAGSSSSAAGAIRDASVSSSPAAIRNSTLVPRVTPKHTPLASEVNKSASANDDAGGAVVSDEAAPKRVDRNRLGIMYDSDDEKPNERLDRKVQLDRAEREKQAASAKTAPGAGSHRKPSVESAQRSRTTERSSDKFKDFLAADDPVTRPGTASSSTTVDARRAATASTSTGSGRSPFGAKRPENSMRFSPISSTSAISRKRTLSPTGSSNGAGSSTVVAPQQTPLKKNRVDESAVAVASVSRIAYKPFHKLLEGVVLVISGIQNPDRGRLRDKALAMGAKYKPDWAAGCTHLICAFKNTPKYNQVHGHGKIIKKDWIAACHDQKKRIPWRRFALDSAEKNAAESEDEIHDLTQKPPEKRAPVPQTSIAVTSQSSTSSSRSDEKPPAQPRFNTTITPEKNSILSSGSDTEDELDRIRGRQQQLTKRSPAPTSAAPTAGVHSDSDDDLTKIDSSLRLKPRAVLRIVDEDDDEDDVYNRTTDEERPPSSAANATRSVTPLPEFYKAKRFYLSNNLDSVETLKLQRFVAVYGGQVIRNAAESDYIVSNKSKQLPGDYRGELVRPQWVFECNDMECLLPTARYKFD